MLQVRFELTTSAFLAPITAYKYGALTDCATGATWFSQLAIAIILPLHQVQRVQPVGKEIKKFASEVKVVGLTVSIRLHHCFNSRMLSHCHSAWGL